MWPAATAAAVFIGVMLTSSAGAWEPAVQGPPPAAGLRGPNPIPGLAGLVETPTTGPDAPRFEVASVKPDKGGAGNSAGLRLLAGGGVRNTNATLRMLIRQAYRLGPQIRRPAGECVMVIPAFAQADPKSSDPAKLSAWPPPGRPGRRCGVGPDGDTMKAGSVTMATLVTLLTPLMDRPVVDKTGLAGTFDFDLRYDGAAAFFPGRGRGLAVSPDLPSDPARAPSIFTALQEQLGLRLDSQRGSVDVLAVLSAELPTEN